MSKCSSAAKKAQISLRNRLNNRSYKSAIKTLTKKYLNSLNSLNNSNYDNVLSNLSFVYSKIDKAVKKGVLHKNTAARKKSILSNAMKDAC
nr:ribosomal protein S20 [Calliblepharis sp.]